MRRRALLAVPLSSLGLLFAATALAEGEITTAPTGNRFSSSTFTIDQGEKTLFRNTDVTVAHNVVSRADGAFESDIIDAGASGPVRGTEFLVTGNYPFVCTLHPGMEATLVVTSAGTPQPRPGTPGDTAPATVNVAIADSRIRPVLKRKALRVRATSDEVATFALTAKSGRTTVAKGRSSVPAGTKTVALKLTSAGRRLLARAKRAKVTVTAAVTDGAGNKSSDSASKTLKR